MVRLASNYSFGHDVPMANVSCAGEKKLSELLLEIYAPGDLVAFRKRMLAAVDRIFGGEMVCHNEINIRNGQSISALCHPVNNFAALRPAFFEHVQDHPSIQHLLARNGEETTAIKTSDFVSQRRWRNCGLYQDFYKPLCDIRYQLTIGHRSGDWLLFFAVSRRNRDFTEDERATMTLLRPHFIQGYEHAKRYSEWLTLLPGDHAQPAISNETGTSPDGFQSEATTFAMMHRFGITRREAEVLLAVGEGKSNCEIAERLHISLSTVKTHLQRIFRRMGVPNRVTALRMALDSSDVTKY
jgi:DNA-binding CsgD family transcriptional regulator